MYCNRYSKRYSAFGDEIKTQCCNKKNYKDKNVFKNINTF